MDTYKKNIIEYFKTANTEVALLILKGRPYTNPKFMVMLDNILYKCGIISVNVIPAPKNKYIAYITFSSGNIFREEIGGHNVHKDPLSFKDAQIKLASKVIELLSEVNYHRLREIIN